MDALKRFRYRAEEITMASCNSPQCRSFKSCCSKTKAFLKKNKENVLLVLLILSMTCGILIGIFIRKVDPPLNASQIMLLGFPGELLMRMLRMMIIPLTISSLISGLANLDLGSSGKIGMRAVIYYMSTTFAAVIIGIILVVTITPGYKANKSNLVAQRSGPNLVVTSDKILDLVRSIFPDNLVGATILQEETVYQLYDCSINSTSTPAICSNPEKILTVIKDNKTVYYTASLNKRDGLNVLGLLVFSIAFGIVLGSMGEAGKPLKDFFGCLSTASMTLVRLIIWYSPIGVCFLIAAKLAATPNLADLIISLGYYMLTVMVGLAVHGAIVLPAIYLVIVRKNPFKFLYGVLQALVTAFATASSAATIPLTMRCLEENNKIDRRVASFVIPVGATVNMDGTALYEAVAALFIAQLNGREMNFGDVVVTSITATVAAIGAAAVPSAGLITMIIVLNSLGLPDGEIAYIVSIDWLLDRFRTMINVLGDAYGAGVVNHLSRKELSDPESNGSNGSNEKMNVSANMSSQSQSIYASNGKVNNGFLETDVTAQDTQM